MNQQDSGKSREGGFLDPTSWRLQRRIIGATQKQVATASRLSARAVRAIEKGDRDPGLAEKKQLVAGLNLLQNKKYGSWAHLGVIVTKGGK